MAGWASRWIDRGEGWPHKVAVLAGHRASEIDYIRRTRTLSGIAEMWKDYLAASRDFAYDEIG